MPPGLFRRDLLRAALGLTALPLIGGRAWALDEDGGGNAMGKDIVMIHGANEGGWCFDTFKSVFEGLGWTCHAPDLIGHGTRDADAAKILVGVGMADYRAELEAFLKTLPPRPVLLGHSMGGVLAQQLAAEGLASALILIAPAPRSGILPPTDAEKQLDQDLMALGPIWKTIINPDFAMARIYTLNRVPEAEQRAVFDKFGPESGRAFFELFFWMFDQTGATLVDTGAVTCPVLCLVGADDKIVSPETARETAGAYPGANFWELPGHGHMLVLEPGAEEIARRIAGWIPA
ncbi:MAG TPA: alpha/beta hydrolase [Methyloceanibacter sp.]|jgi:pimeloyl-ACP methyl ester carboxylesterase|nr:alpha/beta hydrolase [Methyloceanibacter sp.]